MTLLTRLETLAKISDQKTRFDRFKQYAAQRDFQVLDLSTSEKELKRVQSLFTSEQFLEIITSPIYVTETGYNVSLIEYAFSLHQRYGFSKFVDLFRILPEDKRLFALTKLYDGKAVYHSSYARIWCMEK